MNQLSRSVVVMSVRRTPYTHKLVPPMTQQPSRITLSWAYSGGCAGPCVVWQCIVAFGCVETGSSFGCRPFCCRRPPPAGRSPPVLPSKTQECEIRQITYTGELDTAVAALGGSAALLDVQKAKLAAGGLDNPRPVGRGVVTVDLNTSKSAKHPSLVAIFSPFRGQTHGLRRR